MHGNNVRFVFTFSCLQEGSYLICVVCVWWCPTHIVLWICFIFLCVWLVLPVFLDCPFLNAPSVFFNVYKGVRVKFVWLRISIMFPSETCLPMDCCVSELAIIISTRLVGLIQTGHHYTLSSHRMQLILTMIKTYNCSFGLNNNHSLTY